MAGLLRRAALAAALGTMCAAGAAEPAFPSRPLRMLTAGFGGGSDLAARVIAQELPAALGQHVVVDSRVGGVVIGEIPADILTQLHGMIVDVTRTPEIFEHRTDEGSRVAASTPDDHRALIRGDTAQSKKIVEASGIKPQ